MRHINNIICIAALLLAVISSATAQEIKIKSFERNYANLKGSTEQVLDGNGDACAIIRFSVGNKKFDIKPNLGVLKKVEGRGEVLMYVPKGTKIISISGDGMMPLREYRIPVKVESKVVYDAVVTVEGGGITITPYVGVGYSIIGVSGPTLYAGASIGQHQIEAGATLGLNKSADVYYYNRNTTDLKAAYNYKARLFFLRYGFQIPVAKRFSITPQAGAVYSFYNGQSLPGIPYNDDYKKSSAISATIGARLGVELVNHLMLQVTPSYAISLKKDDKCQLISGVDDKFAKWRKGFGLTAGLQINF